MVKKIKFSIWKYLLPAIMMLFMPCVAARADSAGTLLLHFPKEAAGLEIRMYKVAEYDLKTFSYTEDFAENPETLLRWNDAEEMQKVADTLNSFAVTRNIEGTSASVSQDGRIIFRGLSDGLYLIRQAESHAKYQMSPTLVVVPCCIDAGEVTRYVEMYPKITEIPKEPTPDIPKIPSTPESKKKDSEKATKMGKNVKTGDHAPVEFYAGLGLVSLCICAVLYRKKKN